MMIEEGKTYWTRGGVDDDGVDQKSIQIQVRERTFEMGKRTKWLFEPTCNQDDYLEQGANWWKRDGRYYDGGEDFRDLVEEVVEEVHTVDPEAQELLEEAEEGLKIGKDVVINTDGTVTYNIHIHIHS